MRIRYALMTAFAFLLFATPAGTQEPTAQRDFRAMHRWASDGSADHIPGNMAVLLRWDHALRRDSKGFGYVLTKRQTLHQLRNSDNVILKRYAADVSVPGGPDLILLSQMIEAPEPDTTLTYLFDRSGRIVRVFEILLDNSIKEIPDSSLDPLGYEIWDLFVKRIPPKYYD